jgi:hypothetical protein
MDCGEQLYRSNLERRIFCFGCAEHKEKKREIMIKIKITKYGKLKCPRDGEMVSKKECLSCSDIFGIVEGRYVNCKRGLRADDFIKKTQNVYHRQGDKL